MREPVGSPKVSLQLAFEKSTLQLALDPAVCPANQDRTDSNAKAGNDNSNQDLNAERFQRTLDRIKSRVELSYAKRYCFSLRAFLLLKKFMVAGSWIEQESSPAEGDMLPLHHPAI